MEQLRFAAVHEDGQHLVLSTTDGSEVLLPIDARLRAALRTRSAPADAPATPLSPRNVQAMIRAGQSPQDVAEITGWPEDRVARFEGPILAEREHVAGMAQAAHVRGRSAEGGVPTLSSRVLERLAERGVDTDNIGWDATRPEGGPWTVVVSFVAGQRQRAAAWRFDPLDRTVEALDDEARWLSEDEQALPGVATGQRRRGAAKDKPVLAGRGTSGEVELMASMRERSRSRGRRKKVSTSSSDPAGLPQLEHAPEDVLPLEDLAYDPDTMGLPPAAHGESPAPAAATAPEGTTTPSDEATDPAPSRGVADGPGVHDVPLEFDNDHDATAPGEESPGQAGDGEDPSPHEATLEDLFAAEDDVQVELGEEAIDEDAAELGGDLEDAGDRGVDIEDAKAQTEVGPVPGDEADEDETDGDETDEDADRGAADAPDQPEADAAGEQPSARPTRRKDGRPGVPSWDDIMFGAKNRRG